LKIACLIAVPLFCLYGTAATSADIGERLAGPATGITAADRADIGRSICGKPGFEITDEGVHCRACPDYTGGPDDPYGMDIDYLIRGSFSDVDSDEILLDTSGCEAHYSNFGGIILLRETEDTDTQADAGPGRKTLDFVYYRPGYRLNDCTVFDGAGTRALLACNEFWMGQGEVTGHVSIMEVTGRDITRWRLFRWYDNTATDDEEIVSVVPQWMRKRQAHDGEPEALQVELDLLRSSRGEFERRSAPEPKRMSLVFLRKGQRFFADEVTRSRLGELSEFTHGTE
jgi:hypothetical protein